MHTSSATQTKAKELELAVCKDTRDAARESSGERSDRTCNTGRVAFQIMCSQFVFTRGGSYKREPRGP